MLFQVSWSHHFWLQVCLPCEAADAPDAVKVVWKLVDEYTLMEAERAMLKLMRGLDKHLQRVKQATAAAQAATAAGMTAAAGAGETVPAETGATAAAQGETDVAQQQPSAKQGTQSSADTSVWLTREVPPEQSQNAPELDKQASRVAHAPQQTCIEQNGVSSDHLLPQQRPDHQQANASLSDDNQLANVFVDQQPASWTNTRQQPYHFSADQQLAKQHSSRSQQSRHTTSDLPAPCVTTPLEGPILVRGLSDGRKGKLEYRLSQDDVYSPTAAEVQALLQHGAINSSHHLQQQPQQQLPQQMVSQHSVTNGSVSFQLPGRDQSGLAILNGGSDRTSSAAGSMFVNPLVSKGLEAGQDEGRICTDTSGMLCLIQKIQAVQVRYIGVQSTSWHSCNLHPSDLY